MNIIPSINFSNAKLESTPQSPGVELAPSALPFETDWNKTYGLTNRYEVATSLVNTTDGGYAIAGYATTYNSSGYINSQVYWLVKVDALGSQIWDRTYETGSLGARPKQVIQTSDGGFAIIGYTSNDTTLLSGVQLCIIKTDSFGYREWKTTKYEPNGGNVFGYSVAQSTDGGFFIVGTINSTTSQGYDVLELKLNSTGYHDWTKTTYRITSDGVSNDEGYSVANTIDGGYIIAGFSNATKANGQDVYLLKVNSTGDVNWGYLYGGAGNQYGYKVVQNKDGSYAVAGYTYPIGSTNYDVYLIKTDANGNLLWSRTYGGTGDDIATSLVQSSDGGYAMAGQTSSGNYDFLLIKKYSCVN
jgi:hypothetical protein